MTVDELRRKLSSWPSSLHVRFSVADDSVEDPEHRVFCDDGIHDLFRQGNDLVVCLVGQNNSTEKGN